RSFRRRCSARSRVAALSGEGAAMAGVSAAGEKRSRSMETAASAQRVTMEEITALAKRRGFIFQSSEIYGGLNGFWDYGPLGTELKRNVRNAWYHDMVTNHDEFSVPAGAPRAFSMVGLESSLIMHPQV